MSKNKELHNLLESSLKSRVNSVDTSRDIFEEAWIKKDIEMITPSSSIKKSIFPRPLVVACSLSMIFVALVLFSPGVRSIAMEAYNSLRTIFVMDKIEDQYAIIEKNEDTELLLVNIGSVLIDKSNQTHLESTLGFPFYLPKDLGTKDWSLVLAGAGISVSNISYNELENFRKTFFKAIDNNKIFSDLNSYTMDRYVVGSYSYKRDSEFKNKGFYVYIHRERPHSWPYRNVIKETIIDDINCKFVETITADYPTKQSGSWTIGDMTQHPNIIKYNSITWEYNGLIYTITPSYSLRDKEFNEEKALELATLYIKGLKQTSR